MADLAARADVDPVVLREDAARAKEMVAILQAAKKAEDRREKLMAHASTRRERRTLESHDMARQLHVATMATGPQPLTIEGTTFASSQLYEHDDVKREERMGAFEARVQAATTQAIAAIEAKITAAKRDEVPDDERILARLEAGRLDGTQPGTPRRPQPMGAH